MSEGEPVKKNLKQGKAVNRGKIDAATRARRLAKKIGIKTAAEMMEVEEGKK